jgi:hypothetical protein
MDITPIVEPPFISELCPRANTRPEYQTGDVANASKIILNMSLACDTARNFGAKTQKLVTFEWKRRVLSCTELDIVIVEHNLSVILVSFPDGVDETLPFTHILGTTGQTWHHIKAFVDAHGGVNDTAQNTPEESRIRGVS